jgi:hypothetical protein
MGRVFIVQESRDKDISAASEFGQIKVLMRGKLDRQILGDTEALVDSMKEDLKTFTNKDYIVPMGDPSGIGIAVAIAAMMNDGQVNMLKWDKRLQRYIPIEFKIFK